MRPGGGHSQGAGWLGGGVQTTVRNAVHVSTVCVCVSECVCVCVSISWLQAASSASSSNIVCSICYILGTQVVRRRRIMIHYTTVALTPLTTHPQSEDKSS